MYQMRLGTNLFSLLPKGRKVHCRVVLNRKVTWSLSSLINVTRSVIKNEFAVIQNRENSSGRMRFKEIGCIYFKASQVDSK